MSHTIIDCDVEPRVPKKFQLISNRKCGQIVWDPSRIKLLPIDPKAMSSSGPRDGQKERSSVFGNDPGLYPEMWKYGGDLLTDVMKKAWEMGGVPLNACVLDYLLQNEDSVPPDWEDKTIVFVSTHYKGWYGDSAAGWYEKAARTLRTSVFHDLRKCFRNYGIFWKTIALIALPMIVLFSFKEIGHKYTEGMFNFADHLRFLQGYFVPVYVP